MAHITPISLPDQLNYGKIEKLLYLRIDLFLFQKENRTNQNCLKQN